MGNPSLTANDFEATMIIFSSQLTGWRKQSDADIFLSLLSSEGTRNSFQGFFFSSLLAASLSPGLFVV